MSRSSQASVSGFAITLRERVTPATLEASE
jgi:hypothetical protein